MATIDLGPAVDRLGVVIAGVDDDALTAPTPCPDMDVGALLGHIAQFADAFAGAARKEPDQGAPPPTPSGPPADWRTAVPDALAALVASWRPPEAHEGTTAIAGLTMPATAAVGFALDEVVVHGWDLARSTGQRYDVDPEVLDAVAAVVAGVRNGHDGELPGLFGPVHQVPVDAPPLHHVIAATGRDPQWRPPGTTDVDRTAPTST